MADLYTGMQGTAKQLLKDYRQGDIVYVINSAETGPAWDPIPGVPVEHQLDAVAKGVSGYQANSLIQEGDIRITCSVFDAEPELSGRVKINGLEHQIIKVEQVPASGVPVCWRIWVRK